MRRPIPLLWVGIALLVILSQVRGILGPSDANMDRANLVQGLSIATEAKYLVSEYRAVNGAMPCKAGDIEFNATPDYGPAVLSAIRISDCGQVTLVYNEKSGMPGLRMVLEAKESKGMEEFKLRWACWTPDFPDIHESVAQCGYRDAELAAVKIPAPVDESPAPDVGERDESIDAGIAADAGEPACVFNAAVFRPVFTDGIEGRLPQNQIVSYGAGREQMVFFTEVIGAAGKNISHKWFFDGIAIAEYPMEIERDRWPTWSTQPMQGVNVDELRVEVYDDECLIGQAALQAGGEEIVESLEASGWMRPRQALETTLSKPKIDYASTADRNRYVDDLAKDGSGDTILLSAIRRSDAAEALKLINRIKPPDPPPELSSDEANAFRGRYYRRADPFLKDAEGVSPINLAYQLDQEEIVEALIQSAISADTVRRRKTSRIERFSDSLIDTLMSNDGGLIRFDDGDTPLLRAVRTNNERAVLTMLRLSGWNDLKNAYKPTVNVYAYDANGLQALTIARENDYYAIERFLELAMTRKSPGWAVSRATFTTRMEGDVPTDCRKTAFEDERHLHFYSELSDMKDKRVFHEWRFDRKPMQRTAFEVEGNRMSAHSSRSFSPSDVGMWEVRVVTESDEVLHTERLHYQELTDYNRRNRKKFHAPCNMGASALLALVKAQAPVNDIKFHVEWGATLKLNSDLGKKLVGQAIVDGNIPLMGWFLERELDINAYVEGASNPLLLAAANGNSAMALYLLTRGADIGFKRYRDGQTALQLSVALGHEEIVRMLLERGADPNAHNDRGYTSLHSAVGRCNAQITQLLLDYGADPALENDRGETPRDEVAQCERRETWNPPPAGLAKL